MVLLDLERLTIVRRSHQDKGILALHCGFSSSGAHVAISGGFDLEAYVWDPFARSHNGPVMKLVEVIGKVIR